MNWLRRQSGRALQRARSNAASTRLFGLACLAQECAVETDSINHGCHESEQDAYEGEDDPCIEAIVKPMSREIPQHNRDCQSNAELGRHSQSVIGSDGRPCAVRHALARRGTFSLSESLF